MALPSSTIASWYDEVSNFGSISSLDISRKTPAPSRLAKLWKRGSGVGFFSSKNWKEKLVSVGPGGTITYFDDDDISEENIASRVISLVGSRVETRSKGKDSQSFGFQVVASNRKYIFSCDSKENLDLWLKLITQEIALAK
jgi:hypothetical protein